MFVRLASFDAASSVPPRSSCVHRGMCRFEASLPALRPRSVERDAYSRLPDGTLEILRRHDHVLACRQRFSMRSELLWHVLVQRRIVRVGLVRLTTKSGSGPKVLNRTGSIIRTSREQSKFACYRTSSSGRPLCEVLRCGVVTTDTPSVMHGDGQLATNRRASRSRHRGVPTGRTSDNVSRKLIDGI